MMNYGLNVDAKANGLGRGTPLIAPVALNQTATGATPSNPSAVPSSAPNVHTTAGAPTANPEGGKQALTAWGAIVVTLIFLFVFLHQDDIGVG